MTVNAVAPGFTVTNMTVRSAARRGRTLEEHIRITAEASPVRRAGHPEDIAHAVSFFTSEGAGYVTGEHNSKQADGRDFAKVRDVANGVGRTFELCSKVLYVAGAPLG